MKCKHERLIASARSAYPICAYCGKVMKARGEDFSCCGGNDQLSHHTADCPVHPWSVDPAKCSHYYLAAKKYAKLKICKHCGARRDTEVKE